MVMYVRPKSPEQRIDVVEFLESEGFSYGDQFGHSREDVIDSILPLSVDLKERIIGRMGNITCAAAASSSMRLLSPELFMELYEDWKNGKLVVNRRKCRMRSDH